MSMDAGNRQNFQRITNSSQGNTGDLLIEVRAQTSVFHRGHHRFEFRVSPLKGGRFPRSGRLEVRIGNCGYMQDAKRGTQLWIDIEQGQTVALGDALVQVYGTLYQNQLGISTRLDGRFLRGNYIYMMDNPNRFTVGLVERESVMTLIDTDPSSRMTASRSEAIEKSKQHDLWYCASMRNDASELGYGMIPQLPSQWLELTPFTRINIDASSFLALDNTKWDTLQSFVMAGGALRIQHIDDRESVLEKIYGKGFAQACKLSTSSLPKPKTGNPNINSYNGNQPAVEMLETLPGSIQAYRLGLGTIELTLDDTNHDLRIGSESYANHTRRFENGIGDDFWEWLIPKVGKTPVFSFLAFVLFFVGMVAPGLMIWSNRKGRRIWLLLLMPLLAMVGTGGLFAFGIIKDGFTSESRVRSLAVVGEDGKGIVWSRQAYFSAYVPSNGISFTEDAMVTPLTPESIQNSRDFTQSFSDGRMNLTGLLSPRIQEQFCVMHPIDSIAPVGRGESHDPVLQDRSIVNRGESTWQLALFVDKAGALYLAENVPKGATATLTQVDEKEASSRLLKSYSQVPLQVPKDAPSIDQVSLGESFFGRNRWQTKMHLGGMHEEKLWMQLLGSDVNDSEIGKIATKYAPGSFILFVDKAPYLQRCLDFASESNSLHTIVGRW
jgi:hypothetical protein